MAEEAKQKRLCSEIQLFDLCSKEKCAEKEGRYCTSSEMTARFEAISEEDDTMQDRFTEAEDDLDDYDDTENDDLDDVESGSIDEDL